VNSASRLDLNIEQTRQLQNEARLAGVNFGSFENATRSLSAALEDSAGTGRKAAETLSKLGIDAVTSTGQVRGMGPVLLDVIDKLSDLPDKTERAAEGNRILGRGYKELEPLIEKHRELQTELSKYGLILDSNLIGKLSEAETKFSALGIAFDNFKAKLAGKLEPIVIPLIVSLTNPFGIISEGKPAYTISGGPGEGKVGAFFDSLTGESRGAMRAYTETLSNAVANPAVDRILNFNSSQIAAENAGSHSRFNSFLRGQGDSEDAARKNASEARSEYLKSVAEGELLNKSTNKDPEAYAKKTAEISKLKKAADAAEGSLKALEERLSDPKAVREFIARLDAKDENPIAKVFGNSAEFLTDHPYLSSAQRGAVNSATLDAANQILADARDKANDEDFKQDRKLQGRSERDIGSPLMADLLKGLDRFDRDIVARVKRGDETSAEISRINRQSDREQTAAQSSRALRNIELNAGPGTNGQKQAADEAFSYRVAQAEAFKRRELDNIKSTSDALKSAAQVEADYKKLMWEAEDEHETKMLEIQHKRQEEAQAFAGKIFDSLQKPGGFQALIKDQLTGLERQVFTNVASPILGGVGKSISGSMPQGGAWSSVFKGTILDGTGGKDTPVVAAADRTTAAVNEVRDIIAATATGKPLPGGSTGYTPAGVSGSSAPGSPSAVSSLAAWLGIGGMAAASINTIANPPGFPGPKEIDTAGGVTNPTTVSHGYQDSAHTGQASRVLTGSLGLVGTGIAALNRLRMPGVSSASANSSTPDGVSTDPITGDTYSPYSDDEYTSDYGGSTAGPSGTIAAPGGSVAAAVAGGPALAAVAGSASTANTPSSASGIVAALSSFKGSAATPGGPFSSAALGNLADAFAGGTPGQQFGAALGEGAAIAGPVAAGTLEALKQFSNGGVRGALGGTSAILGTAAALDPEPISKGILGAAAMITGIVKAILPDPRQVRAQQESEAITQEAYLAPPTINSNQSVNGQNVSYNKYGEAVTTGQFSGFDVTQPYQIKDQYTGNYVTVPGSVTNISPGSATPPSAAAGNSIGAPSAPQVTIHVSAMDSQSFMDRSADIGAAVYAELSKGGALASRVSSVVLGS
jgi:hypothetical protein